MEHSVVLELVLWSDMSMGVDYLCNTEMKAVLPLSVLAMDKIPQLKIPEGIGEHISATEA